MSLPYDFQLAVIHACVLALFAYLLCWLLPLAGSALLEALRARLRDEHDDAEVSLTGRAPDICAPSPR